MAPIISELPVIPLSIHVESPNEINTVGRLQLQVTITNHGSETLTIVRDPSGVLSSTYRTPKFTISPPDGKKDQPRFKGVKVKFSPQKAAELGMTVVIGPNQTTRTPIEHDLSRTYDFSRPGAGSYTFTPNNFFYIVDPVSREIRLVKADKAPSVLVKISGTLVLADVGGEKEAKKEVKKSEGVVIIGGTPEQRAQVESAVKAAGELIDDGDRFLQANVSIATPQYETWFGRFDESLMDIVSTIYGNIKGGPSTARYDLDDCDDDTLYARVFADDKTKTIYLCKLFWSAPLIGINSQAGTIIHELTHFNANGFNNTGTSDWAYGVVSCRQLAVAIRRTACYNADSYEYFAELLGLKTATGSFFSSKDGFFSSFVLPNVARPTNFEGKFNETTDEFSTANAVLIYNDAAELTGTYDIQAGSTVQRKKINLKLTNESEKECQIMANLTPNITTDSQVTGGGTWS